MVTPDNSFSSHSLDNRNNKSDYKNVSILEILKIYGYVLKLGFKKQKRNRSLINQEYNSRMWNQKFEEIDFESLIGNYERKDIAKYVIVTYNDKPIKIVGKNFEKIYHSQIFKVLEEFREDSVIELGCGLGANLFMLHNEGFKKLGGYDLSENAINHLRRYSKMKGYDIHFDVHDLNKTFSSDMIKDKIVFTHTCLEQCKHIMSNVLRNILEGKPKLVINFEVNYDDAPFMVRKYLDSQDYQNNLVRELQILKKQGKIEILSIKKLLYTSSPVNRPSLIIWKPKLKN